MATTDIAAEVRKNLALAKRLDRHNREAHRENLRVLNNEQWEPAEVQKRNQNKRLMLTADMLNAPVDQVVNSVKQNRPGPDVKPAGGGADQESAYIKEGIMRRIDYESSSWVPIETAMEYATGGNFGCFGIELDYKNDHSNDRVIKVYAIPDCNETVYFDPKAKRKDRKDARWAVELFVLSEDKYREDYKSTKLQSWGKLSQMGSYLMSTFRDDTVAGWVTEDGVQLARYWKVNRKKETLREYSNGLSYWDSERDYIPEGVEADNSKPSRDLYRNEVKWYVCDGLEVLKSGDWSGQWIPLFPVYGREKWIAGKRYISSLIQFAIEAQRAFNYAFTGACEMLAITSKAPWVGMVGQFKTKLTDWINSNQQIIPFLEYDEVTTEKGETAPPPQRNVNEAPINSFLQFCMMCVNAVQRATSIFDPSLGKQKSQQSGKAIQELQEQSTEGNFHWSGNLTIALTAYYEAMGDLIDAEYDAPQVIEIMRPDNKIEIATINREYQKGNETKHHRITQGHYSYAVQIGKAAITERQAVAAKVEGVVKNLPPEMVASIADLLFKLYDLGPIGQQITERLTPPAFRNQEDPQAAAQQLAQAMQENQKLKQAVQQLQKAIETKQPELELKKYLGELNALVGLEESKIKAGQTTADRDVSHLELLLGFAHDRAMQAGDHEHAAEVNTEQLDAQKEMQESANEQSNESEE